MKEPNGTLELTTEHGYTWTTKCRKCGTVQKIRIGHLSHEDAAKAVRTISMQPGECPGGYHVELSGWSTLWSLDLMLAKYSEAIQPNQQAA